MKFLKSLCVISAVASSLASVNAQSPSLFIADPILGEVSRYDLSGERISGYAIEDVASPYGLAGYGSQLFLTDAYKGVVGQYTESGQVVNSSLITGVQGATWLGVSDSGIYVCTNPTTIAKYTLSGQLVNASFISGLMISSIAVSGSDIYVSAANQSWSQVYKYTSDGDLVSNDLIGTATFSATLAVSGGELYVSGSNGVNGTISKFTTSGIRINGDLISDLTAQPKFLAVSDGMIYALDGATVRKYTTQGTVVNSSLIETSGYTVSLAVVVPEPSTYAMFAMGAGVVLMVLRRRGQPGDGLGRRAE